VTTRTFFLEGVGGPLSTVATGCEAQPQTTKLKLNKKIPYIRLIFMSYPLVH
jgi:hypothetical protein